MRSPRSVSRSFRMSVALDRALRVRATEAGKSLSAFTAGIIAEYVAPPEPAASVGAELADLKGQLSALTLIVVEQGQALERQRGQLRRAFEALLRRGAGESERRQIQHFLDDTFSPLFGA